jgi:hypothetical protein
MKAIMTIIGVVLATFVVASFCNAGSTRSKAYYHSAITKKIAQCEQVASMQTATIPSIRRAAKIKDVQADFYKDHREELIAEMARRNIRPEPYRVDYFLTTAFFDMFYE